MKMHFYTTLIDLENIREGRVGKVWTKDHARPYEVHISLCPNEYHVEWESLGLFLVKKWRKTDE